MVIDSAPPAAPLTLADTSTELFKKRDQPTVPCMLGVAGSSNFELQLFRITATGKVQADSACNLTIILYAAAGTPDAGSWNDPAMWLPIASAPAEPIGGLGDLKTTSFMIQGTHLLYNLSSGKMQGTFISNVADHPSFEADLEHDLMGIKPNVDPVITFAVGAMIDASEATLELVHFTMDD